MENQNRVIALNCMRCGWNWPQKGIDKPMTCPKCKSPYWNAPRKNKVANHNQQRFLEEIENKPDREIARDLGGN